MSFNLRNRSFLKLDEFTPQEISFLLRLSAELKAAKYAGTEVQRLRGKQAGAKFRNQHPIGPYVVDFYCSVGRLVFEVDGEVHNRGDRPARDERRDAFLHENGYRVIHIPAGEILKDADEVAAGIASLVANPLHHRPTAGGPPPHAGEEL